MSERGESLSSERERTSCWRSSLCFHVLLLPLVLILSLRKLRGFLIYGFHKENSLCLLSLVFIVVHVIRSDKILKSYFLNDKNLTCLSLINKFTKNELSKTLLWNGLKGSKICGKWSLPHAYPSITTLLTSKLSICYFHNSIIRQ